MLDPRCEPALISGKISGEGGAGYQRRVAQQQRALPHVVERQRRQGHERPREADGQRAEVAQVGVEALGPRHAQHDVANRRQQLPLRGLVVEEGDGVGRVEGVEDAGLEGDLLDARDGEHEEPEEDQRAEDAADEARAVVLDAEEQDEDGDADGHGVARQRGGGDGDALEGGQHRDGRRENGVGVEERRAQKACQSINRMSDSACDAGSNQENHLA